MSTPVYGPGQTSNTTPGYVVAPASIGGGNFNQAAAAQAAAQYQGPSNSALAALQGLQVPTSFAYQGSQLEPNMSDAQQVALQFYGWNDQQKSDFRNQLGLINTNYYTAPNDTLANAWFDYVRQAAEQTAAGHPVDAMDLLAADVNATNGGKGKAGKTITKTVDQVNLTNRADAQAIYFQAAQQLLGRAPTDSEVAQFQGYLNAQERANPIQQVKQITYAPEGYVTDTNVLKSSGGISSQAAQTMAMEQARQNPEYGAYQAATTYFNALKQAIGLGG